MSSKEAVVGDQSVELGLFWVCPGPEHSFSLAVLVCTHKNLSTGTVGELLTGCGRVGWDGHGTALSLCCPCSVMRTARSTTTRSTWGCPAARRITTAAPTSPPASSSSAAPKRPSQSPHSSLLPNWPRMVSCWSLRAAQDSRNLERERKKSLLELLHNAVLVGFHRAAK